MRGGAAAAGALRHVVYNNESNRLKFIKMGGLDLLVARPAIYIYTPTSQFHSARRRRRPIYGPGRSSPASAAHQTPGQ